eukprot:CAMPEP_0179873394 /NCGR_PEP_ID=MMETSP0982-20121206/22148_1 /TAXON_ID=483367 /ORGANISM="non described non described, Strain CCMP 2436" /LENGTH=233 /DNA_ID=CAMNT_0021764753 /DNA_START=292 /DNA_END=992 /DNA_ORIENTATION=-
MSSFDLHMAGGPVHLAGDCVVGVQLEREVRKKLAGPVGTRLRGPGLFEVEEDRKRRRGKEAVVDEVLVGPAVRASNNNVLAVLLERLRRDPPRGDRLLHHHEGVAAQNESHAPRLKCEDYPQGGAQEAGTEDEAVALRGEVGAHEQRAREEEDQPERVILVDHNSVRALEVMVGALAAVDGGARALGRRAHGDRAGERPGARAEEARGRGEGGSEEQTQGCASGGHGVGEVGQ